MREYFMGQRALLEEDEDAAREWFPFELAGERNPADRTALAAWVGIARVVMNSDEFITRE